MLSDHDTILPSYWRVHCLSCCFLGSINTDNPCDQICYSYFVMTQYRNERRYFFLFKYRLLCQYILFYSCRLGGKWHTQFCVQERLEFHVLIFGFFAAGNGWVAWRNDSFPNHFVEMIFEFDQIRNFSSLHIFTNNFFTKNVQVM